MNLATETLERTAAAESPRLAKVLRLFPEQPDARGPKRADDFDLVLRALTSDRDGARAQDELYRKYRPAVARIAASFNDLDADEADDVVQESFVRAFRALKSLKEPTRFAAWLFTITRNRARSYLTARSTHRQAVEDAQRELDVACELAPAACELLEQEVRLRAVREVIESLKDGPEKETVRLFYLEGTLSAREIASRMGVGKSAVTMRLERFRARVRSQLIRSVAG